MLETLAEAVDTAPRAKRSPVDVLVDVLVLVLVDVLARDG